MKKILSLLLGVTMCSSLFLTAGCGEQKADKTADGRMIIRMAHWDQGGKEAEEAPLKLIKEEFEKTHPDYCLEYTLYSGYESQFLNIMASGDIPDIFLVPDGDFGASTSDALYRYQDAKGLLTDRVAGSAVWSSLLGL